MMVVHKALDLHLTNLDYISCIPEHDQESFLSAQMTIIR